jgi:2-polyprenyl-3-methyl-5-hydroxy-6-metoxy-1,4-benzoquinol methylase
MALDHIVVPDSLQRNAPDVLADGVEETGASLLRGLARRIGKTDLAGLHLLDVGCGVRFTQTLINRRLLFASYTGIDVSRPIINWLKEHVEEKDDRFRFVQWNVRNAMYNPQAPTMDSYDDLPVSRDYDVIMGFSLFTHLAPPDATCVLRFTRKAIRPDGFLFFSAFCDDSIDEFDDRVPDRPLLNAYYNKKYLMKLINETGWVLLSYEQPVGYVMDSFLCRPAA